MRVWSLSFVLWSFSLVRFKQASSKSILSWRVQMRVSIIFYMSQIIMLIAFPRVSKGNFSNSSLFGTCIGFWVFSLSKFEIEVLDLCMLSCAWSIANSVRRTYDRWASNILTHVLLLFMDSRRRVLCRSHSSLIDLHISLLKIRTFLSRIQTYLSNISTLLWLSKSLHFQSSLRRGERVLSRVKKRRRCS